MNGAGGAGVQETQTVTVRAINAPEPVYGDPSGGLIVAREYRHGRILTLATDYGVANTVADLGEYFEGELHLIRRLVPEGATVISAGGNIGVHLIPISRMVGPAGRVITFEPQEFIREKLLVPNLAMNGCDNVQVCIQAIGSGVGTATLPLIDYTLPNNFGGLGLVVRGAVEVPVVPIDWLKLDRCDMIMLDIEGAELPALHGARETIMRHRPYLYVEIDRIDLRDSVLEYMRMHLNYELLLHQPRAFSPDNFAGVKDNRWGDVCSMMCLGVPR